MILHFVGHLFRQFRFRMPLIGIVMVISSLTEGFGVALLLPILELLTAGEQDGAAVRTLASMLQLVGIPLTLGSGLAILFLMILVQSGLGYVREWLVARTLADLQTSLRDRLYRSLFDSKWSYFLHLKRGELISCLTMECERAGRAFLRLMQAGVGVVTICIYVAVSLLIAWKLTLGMLVVASVLVALLKRRLGRGGDVGRETSRVNAEYQTILSEHFDAAKVVMASGMQRLTASQARDSARRVAEVEYRSLINSAILRTGLEPLVIGTLCIGVYVTVAILGMSLSSIMVVMFVFYRLFPRITVLNDQAYQFLISVPAFEHLDGLATQAQENRETRAEGGVVPVGLRDAIEFRDVWFSYGGRETVLQGLSLRISRGETVALVGASGQGKSTTVDMLLGLLDPDRGGVFVDDRPLRVYDLMEWRKLVAYVTQETVILNNTIRANISWGLDQSLTDEELTRISESANITEFIARLPMGYDTIVGDRGVCLSGGQRQRLALARALARQPQVLVLDEATSNLDAESEARIQTALEHLAGKLTVLVIAHRFSTFRHATRICVLERGRVVESGTWEELEELNGRFAQVRALQRA